jgi:hypothetical protein
MVKVACDERDEGMMSMYGRSRGIQLNGATVVDLVHIDLFKSSFRTSR